MAPHNPNAAIPHTHHPSVLRNRIPILKQLLKIIPDESKGNALEIASGTGALLEVLAPAFPNLSFRPSEYVPCAKASMDEQWSKHGKIGLRSDSVDELANIDNNLGSVFNNVQPAVALDLMAGVPWPSTVVDGSPYDLIICANTLHITPYECSKNFLKGASTVVSNEGNIVVYGPFKIDDKFVGKEDGGEGNRAFDVKLRETNSEWGIRNVNDLEVIAKENGLILKERIEMPKNNFILRFGKA